MPISDIALAEAYDWVVEQDISIKQLLEEDVADALVTTLANAA